MPNGAGGTRWPVTVLPSPPPAAAPDAGSTQAVEVEAEGSVARSYPTGARGREMSRDDHRRAIGEGLEEAPACRARRFGIYAEAAVELGFGALQRGVHDIAAQDHGCLRGPRHDADMAGCVPRPRLDPYTVVERIIHGNQLGLATVHDGQQAVLVVRIGRVCGSPFSDLPVLPFLARKEVAGVREGRYPSAVEEPRVPTDVIGVQMRAQHIVDMLLRKAGGGEIGEIRPILPVISQLVRALLVIARASVDQNGRPRRLYDCAVKREDHKTAGRVHQRRFEPGPMSRNDLRRRLGMNHGRLEQRSLELKHTGDFDLAHAPAVNRAVGPHHCLLLLFWPKGSWLL